MFKKVYTANIAYDGKTVGALVVRVWFWVSPYDAWDGLALMAKNQQANICHFRRVK